MRVSFFKIRSSLINLRFWSRPLISQRLIWIPLSWRKWTISQMSCLLKSSRSPKKIVPRLRHIQQTNILTSFRIKRTRTILKRRAVKQSMMIIGMNNLTKSKNSSIIIIKQLMAIRMIKRWTMSLQGKKSMRDRREVMCEYLINYYELDYTD